MATTDNSFRATVICLSRYKETVLSCSIKQLRNYSPYVTHPSFYRKFRNRCNEFSAICCQQQVNTLCFSIPNLYKLYRTCHFQGNFCGKIWCGNNVAHHLRCHWQQFRVDIISNYELTELLISVIEIGGLVSLWDDFTCWGMRFDIRFD